MPWMTPSRFSLLSPIAGIVSSFLPSRLFLCCYRRSAHPSRHGGRDRRRGSPLLLQTASECTPAPDAGGRPDAHAISRRSSVSQRPPAPCDGRPAGEAFDRMTSPMAPLLRRSRESGPSHRRAEANDDGHARRRHAAIVRPTRTGTASTVRDLDDGLGGADVSCPNHWVPAHAIAPGRARMVVSAPSRDNIPDRRCAMRERCAIARVFPMHHRRQRAFSLQRRRLAYHGMMAPTHPISIRRRRWFRHVRCTSFRPGRRPIRAMRNGTLACHRAESRYPTSFRRPTGSPWHGQRTTIRPERRVQAVHAPCGTHARVGGDAPSERQDRVLVVKGDDRNDRTAPCSS